MPGHSPSVRPQASSSGSHQSSLCLQQLTWDWPPGGGGVYIAESILAPCLTFPGPPPGMHIANEAIPRGTPFSPYPPHQGWFRKLPPPQTHARCPLCLYHSSGRPSSPLSSPHLTASSEAPVSPPAAGCEAHATGSLTGPGSSHDDYMLTSLSSWRGPPRNVNHRFISAPFMLEWLDEWYSKTLVIMSELPTQAPF